MCKKREKVKLVEVIQRVVYGDPKEVMQLIGADSGAKINTAYIERLNLTIRNSLAGFVRKSMNCSKILGMRNHALDFFRLGTTSSSRISHFGKGLIKEGKSGCKEHLQWQKE